MRKTFAALLLAGLTATATAQPQTIDRSGSAGPRSDAQRRGEWIEIDVHGAIDADAVAHGLASELQGPVHRVDDTCVAPCVTVVIEDTQATVVFTAETGATRERTVALGDDRAQWPMLVTLLASNLVRDEAAAVLPLIPAAAPPVEQAAAPVESHASSTFAIGVVPVLSSDFADLDRSHDLSLWLIAGVSRDVDGLSVSGIVDVARGTVSGAQVAGVAAVARRLDGIQLGGIATVAGHADGLQLAGIVAAAHDSEGLQIAGTAASTLGHADVQVAGVVAAAGGSADLQVGGVVAASLGNADAQFGGVVAAAAGNSDLQIGGVVAATTGNAGVQFGGAVAASTGDADFQIGGAVAAATGNAGVQFGGAVAVATGNADLQIGGAVAASTGEVGLQIAGAVAYASKADGLQIAGAVNAAGDVDGMQIAGAVNVAGSVDGMQIAPINIAGHVDGVQLGVINIGGGADDDAFGLINIVPGGRTDLEGTIDSSSIGALMLRHGGRHFHNVYAIAGQHNTGGMDDVWMYGLGLGPSFHVASVPVDLDAIAWEVNHGSRQEDHLSLLGQLRLTLTVPHTPIVVGAELSSYVSTDHTSPFIAARTTMPGQMMSTDATWRVWPSLFVGARL